MRDTAEPKPRSPPPPQALPLKQDGPELHRGAPVSSSPSQQVLCPGNQDKSDNKAVPSQGRGLGQDCKVSPAWSRPRSSQGTRVPGKISYRNQDGWPPSVLCFPELCPVRWAPGWACSQSCHSTSSFCSRPLKLDNEAGHSSTVAGSRDGGH